MAMSKEEQRAAAERILAKSPMTEQEKRAQRWLETVPEDYPTNRTCPWCPAEFPKEQINEHAAHLASHGASPAEWGEAYKRIVKAKEKAREVAKAEERRNLSV